MAVRGKRRTMWAMTAAMVLLVACGPGQICESDTDRMAREQDQLRMLEQLRLSQQALSATPTAAASATAATSAAPKAPATAAAAGPYSGTIKLGFDHPPFAPGNANLGGASAGIVCGKVTGAPAGGIIFIDVTGGTGAPPSVNGPIGHDGAFILPFPINSYGPMEAKVSGVRTGAGATLSGSIAPAKLEVGGGADVACTP